MNKPSIPQSKVAVARKSHTLRIKFLTTLLGMLVMTEVFLELFVYPHMH